MHPLDYPSFDFLRDWEGEPKLESRWEARGKRLGLREGVLHAKGNLPNTSLLENQRFTQLLLFWEGLRRVAAADGVGIGGEKGRAVAERAAEIAAESQGKVVVPWQQKVEGAQQQPGQTRKMKKQQQERERKTKQEKEEEPGVARAKGT